jgi:D-aminopeptidase
MKARLRDYGVSIGSMTPGPRDSIADVDGVTVGHCTVDAPERGVRTGVTVLLPARGSLFREKLPAGAAVFNGFGKSMGLMQIEEKGTLETAIVLTGVSSAGSMYDALFRREMERDPEICREEGSVNPLICECNDSFLNDARATALGREHLEAAFASASPGFEEGAVGAGRGMSCFQLKGGIGSSSRVIDVAVKGFGKKTFSLGVLVLANFGELSCLTMAGRVIGPEVEKLLLNEPAPGALKSVDRGSIILVVGTDAPLDARQLKRLAKRAFIGVGRVGSFVGDGSGDVAIAFSTAYRVPHTPPETGVVVHETLHESGIDPFFKGTAEAAEEAILNALVAASPLRGRNGHERHSLSEFLPEILQRHA